ncbi:MAG: protein kinase [Candidatus Aminicenantes bacterium]|nr:protein kinase [Candidatus Aminicenantes bacterium]
MNCPKCKTEVPADNFYCHKCGSSLRDKKANHPAETTKDFSEDNPFIFSPGDDFGSRYKIIEELGRGGMGIVYKAEDKVLNTTAALKTIKPEFLTDQRMISRFKEEIRLAREIAHENVVRIYDFGEVGEVKFISMQYIEGISLKDMLAESGPLPIEKTKAILKQICMGLLAAHKKGIVHRDLNPNNIMIDKGNNVYITDFGLAKSADSTGITHSGALVGTPRYIAPEQWLGEKVDNRVDIYMLGIIIFEMITGEHPFVSETDLGYLHKHLRAKPVFPDKPGKKIPTYLKNIVKKCLEKKRKYRYQCITDLLVDMDSSAIFKGPFLQRFKQNRLPRLTAIFIFILLALFGAFKLAELLKEEEIFPPKKIRVAVLPFTELTGQPLQNNLEFTFFHLLTTDLEQSKFFWVLPENRLLDIFGKIKHKIGSPYTTEVYKKITSEENIDYFLIGSYMTSGGKMRVTVRILNPRSGENLSTFTEDMKEEEAIFSIVDSLTPDIKAAFNIPHDKLEADVDENIETITTSSREALERYSAGKLKFNEEKYEESILLFKEAIELDPGYALVYKEIALAYAVLQKEDQKKKYYDKAMQYRQHLSAKKRLLLEAGFFSNAEETFKKAVSSFKKLLKIYPGNYEANTHFGGLLTLLQDWRRALPYLERAADGINDEQMPYIFLTWTYMAEGRYDKAVAVEKNYHRNFPGKIRPMLYGLVFDIHLIKKAFLLAWEVNEKIAAEDNKLAIFKFNKGKIYLYRGDLEKAEQEFKNMPRDEKDERYYSDRIRNLRLLYLHQGRFAESIKLLKENFAGMKDKEDKLLTAYELVHLYLRLGKPHRALAAIKNYIKLDETPWPVYFLGRKLFYEALAYLKLGQNREAGKTIKELEGNCKKSPFKKDYRYYYLAKSRLERENKNFDRAVSYLKKALSYGPHEYKESFFSNQQAMCLFELALTYYKKGSWEKAGRQFDKITALTLGRFYFGDVYVKSFYYLGKIYQELGREKEALENYKEFLRLWEKADPGQIEIEDAHTQLQRLNNNQ